MKVLKEVEEERQGSFCYGDEKIASNLYYAACSYSIRALAGMTGAIDEKIKQNRWLCQGSRCIRRIPVLSFDNIKNKLANGKTSCDAFFYDFEIYDEG